jgi:hypothetical protein
MVRVSRIVTSRWRRDIAFRLDTQELINQHGHHVSSQELLSSSLRVTAIQSCAVRIPDIPPYHLVNLYPLCVGESRAKSCSNNNDRCKALYDYAHHIYDACQASDCFYIPASRQTSSSSHATTNRSPLFPRQRTSCPNLSQQHRRSRSARPTLPHRWPLRCPARSRRRARNRLDALVPRPRQHILHA